MSLANLCFWFLLLIAVASTQGINQSDDPDAARGTSQATASPRRLAERAAVHWDSWPIPTLRPWSTYRYPPWFTPLRRVKRVTCDLFSFQTPWVTPNHSACAAHCMLKGFKGGNCQSTVCVCRDKTWG